MQANLCLRLKQNARVLAHFLLTFFEDIALTRAHYITYTYNLQISNYFIEKACFL